MKFVKNRRKTIIVLTLLMALVVASCSGSGSGNSGTTTVGLSSLVVADHVSVVDSTSGGGGAKPMPTGLKALLLGLMSSQLPAESDYMKDTTSVYVNERSTGSFEEINNILCMVRQTRYDAMVNKGAYLALVDENSCRSDKSDAERGGSQSTNTSSGANMPSYMTWVTESIRASDSLPQIVNFWIVPSEEDMIVLARMTIMKGADEAPPYGIFRLDFQMVNTVTHKEFGKGVLVAERDSTGNAVLRFAQNDPYLENIDSATLVKDPSGTSGHGTVFRSESWSGTTEVFDIAYNDLYFRRHDISNMTPDDPITGDICLDRNNFSESAWSYGLYNQDGSRFNLTSGFSIKAGQDYGWIGYWGVWLPETVSLGTGSVVYRHEWDTNTDTPYTVVQAGGKLKKHTKKTIPLSQIRNVPLYWYDYNAGAYYTIIWDSLSGKFIKTAWQDSSGQWKNCSDLSAPCGAGPWDLNLSTLNSSDINVWSQALSGSVRIPLASAATGTTTCTYSPTNGYTNCSGFTNNLSLTQRNSTPVIFYTENIVYPGDIALPITLACFDNCPQAADANGIDPTATSIPFYPSWDPTNGQSLRHDYTFSPSSMLLMDGLNPVILPSTADTNHQWGVTTGALFDPTPDNLVLLDCNWDGDDKPATNPQVCGWKAGSELSEFYNWETGPNSWNQLYVLKDSNNLPVRFDPPLQVKYTHAQSKTTAPDYKYDGATFYLEYNGFGSLSGIPGVCVDIDTGEVGVSCGPDTWWVPEFLIPAAQTDGNLTEVYYGEPPKPLFIKPLQIEQRMINAGVDVCNNVVPTPLTTESYPLSDMHEWREPAIGTPPNITSGPKVIGGVVQ